MKIIMFLSMLIYTSMAYKLIKITKDKIKQVIIIVLFLLVMSCLVQYLVLT